MAYPIHRKIVVREALDGRRYYDHYETVKGAGEPPSGGMSGERPGSESLRPTPNRGSATEAADRGIIPDDGEDGPVRSQGPVQGPGTAYQGLISQAYTPGATRPVRSRRVIRREDVLRPLLKALNVPLYQGRVKGRGMERTLGYYLPKREAVRIRKKNDLEVAAHELAHLIDDRVFNGFRVNKNRPSTRPWNPGAHPQWKIFNQELKSVSYDEAKTYEGFAEFIRLWMTQPSAARSKAPAFSRWWENEFVAKHATGPALRQAQKDMTEWFRQQAVDRAASKIGGDETSKVLANVQDTMWDNGRQAIFDDLHGL